MASRLWQFEQHRDRDNLGAILGTHKHVVVFCGTTPDERPVARYKIPAKNTHRPNSAQIQANLHLSSSQTSRPAQALDWRTNREKKEGHLWPVLCPMACPMSCGLSCVLGHDVRPMGMSDVLWHVPCPMAYGLCPRAKYNKTSQITQSRTKS